jgi:NAD(P)H-dependent FMN reductase
MKIKVIISTTREGRFADKPAQWVMDHLGSREDMELDLIDLRDHPLPFFEGGSPARAPREYISPEVERFAKRVDEADGFIVLLAEYNHGYSAVLKNAMDYTFVEWNHKPMSFVGWGNVGGARAIEQLRLVAVEFEMAPLRHAVHIPGPVMMEARQSDDVTTVFEPLVPRLDLLADDLMWWTQALAAARAK